MGTARKKVGRQEMARLWFVQIIIWNHTSVTRRHTSHSPSFPCILVAWFHCNHPAHFCSFMPLCYSWSPPSPLSRTLVIIPITCLGHRHQTYKNVSSHTRASKLFSAHQTNRRNLLLCQNGLNWANRNSSIRSESTIISLYLFRGTSPYRTLIHTTWGEQLGIHFGI
jgi:hypothetical protein